MADFTQIIQEINDDINTNGVGAITGAKLNEVLRDMIAAVNEEKQDPLTIDATPTEDSTNPVQSGGVYDELEDKADKVSGATQGNLAGLDSYGNLTDSGIAASDVATNSDVVHNTGAETVAGRKTFSDGIVVALDNNIRFNTDSQGHGVDIFASEDLDNVKRLSLADMEHEEDCRLGGIATPDVSNDAANKEYVDGQVSAKYSKPSGGIPASDLTSAVQTSLGKADTAVQPSDLATVATSGSYNDLLNKPTIPAAQVQSDWNEADNTKVDYIKNKPTIPDVSGKADKVVGATSGDVATLDSNGNLTDSGLSVFDFFVMVEDASTPPASILPNTVYKYGTLSGNTTFPPLATPTEPDIANVYCWTFSTPSTAPTITWPSAITSWAGGSAPTINASKSYEVSVMDGFATIIEN